MHKRYVIINNPSITSIPSHSNDCNLVYIGPDNAITF